MTYRDLLKKITLLSTEQLDSEVQVFQTCEGSVTAYLEVKVADGSDDELPPCILKGSIYIEA